MTVEVDVIKALGDGDPFPVSLIYTIRETRATIRKYLGKGTYRAGQFGQTVTISASGSTPNFNTIVKLEQSPLTIFPPQFALYFYDSEIQLPAQMPFHVEAHIHTPERIKMITVFDADGRHEVPVENF